MRAGVALDAQLTCLMYDRFSQILWVRPPRLKAILEALRLSPRDITAYQWMHFVGSAKIQVGVDEGLYLGYK
jgi:hypothetical protein